MRKLFTYISFGLFLLPYSCMPKQNSLENLNLAIEKKIQFPGAQFGIAFEDLQTGKTISIHGDDIFHAASTMKTPVLVELYRQAAVGKFSMEDSIIISNSFHSIADGSEFSLDSADDSEFELYKEIGRKRTIASLAYEMIIRSSNVATNLLIELITPDSVMSTMQSLGLSNLKVLRGVEDGKAFEKGMNNSVSANDLAGLFKLMANHKLVNEQASKNMIEILLKQEFNEIIPARLPGTVRVAHKTGSITGVQHDSGIIFLADGRKYVLVLLSRFNKENENEVIQLMADISKLVYDYMNSEMR